jgi:TonB-linked SusC/RagA family outer membrane protein
MRRSLLVLLVLVLVAGPAFAQQRTITGKVTSEQGTPLSGVSVTVKGTSTATSTNIQGDYAIAAQAGQVLRFRLIGTGLAERSVGTDDVINVQLRRVALDLDAVVVTALGATTEQRALGTAQQTIVGSTIKDAQRENFVNSLQGRIAGVDVTSTSGVPGASASIVIRGITSISGSNQPLIIVDGLPMDNRTLNTGVLASDANSNTALSNRTVDFTNRAADLNPDDIETLTVLKGPEAAALYGIDAANGAIVITTKRGKSGGGVEYSSTFRVERTRATTQLQGVYGPTTVNGDGSVGSFFYFGAPYAPGTTFYDNINGFLRTGTTATTNLSFSGASTDNHINYRLSTAVDKQNGVVPSSDYSRINVSAASQAQVSRWLNTDLSMTYTYNTNDQVFKGSCGAISTCGAGLGPLINLMLWPQTDNAKDYLTPSGLRRRLTSQSAASEPDNPYFNISRNKLNAKTNRIMVNLGVLVTPFSWGSLKTNLGSDSYTNQNLVLRHPETAEGLSTNGVLDNADVVTRNLDAQTVLDFNRRPLTSNFSISGLVGHYISDHKSTTDAAVGTQFLDPNFISLNNTSASHPAPWVEQRRQVSVFGKAVVDYKNFWYVTVTGRNDWTSTMPPGKGSFFYPSISTSFVFSDAFPSIGRFMTGKVRAAYAQVGKDAKPYAFRPSLQNKTTSYGGYGYNFWGPNLNLKPEFAKSWEIGAELSFFNNRLGLDGTVYRKVTQDQIVNDVRGSYGTGFILFNLNGASTRARGLELTVRATPIHKPDFSWDVQANWASAGQIVTSLPRGIPESYVSDTWLYGNVRNGVTPGGSTMSLTGYFYVRNTRGDLLIDPTTGLPIRSNSLPTQPFLNLGYDRQPDFTIGLTNTFRYNRWSLDFLLDIRKGGDVFDATDHFLTTHGLSMQTLDRDQPRVIKGVLADGKQNTDNPTINTIVVVPSLNPAYYTSMSEELFIERDINWLRLRDLQVSYALPDGFLGSRSASVFVKGTDLFLWTNYTGLDPIVNGNTAAVGGSGAVGIDFGNFPMPRGVNFGIRMGF